MSHGNNGPREENEPTEANAVQQFVEMLNRENIGMRNRDAFYQELANAASCIRTAETTVNEHDANIQRRHAANAMQSAITRNNLCPREGTERIIAHTHAAIGAIESSLMETDRRRQDIATTTE